MIVPQKRLLTVTLFMVPLLGILFSGTPYSSLAAILFGLVVLVVLLDGVLPNHDLSGLTMTVPSIVRLTKGKESSLQILVKSELKSNRLYHFGLPLHGSIFTPELIQSARVHIGVGVELNWSCTGRERGQYSLDHLFFECPSRLGLWALRGKKDLMCQIRVYPDLLKERKVMSALFLNSQGGGLHSQRQLGQGKEFEKLRSYIPGDSFTDIHWKASAKRNHLVTKEFRTEKTQELYVIVDGARLSSRTAALDIGGVETKRITVLERFVTAALIMGLAAEKQGDLFGVMSFSNTVKSFIRAKSGKQHFQICRDALFHLQSKSVSPDFDELCTFIRLKLRKRALLIFLVNLDDPVISENFIKSVELISRRHLVMVGMIQDRVTQPLFSAPSIYETDDLYTDLAAHLKWKELQKVKKVLLRRGVQFRLFPNEDLCLGLVTQYMNIKQRQLL